MLNPPTEIRFLVSGLLTLAVAIYFFTAPKRRLNRIIAIVLLLTALFLLFASADIDLRHPRISTLRPHYPALSELPRKPAIIAPWIGSSPTSKHDKPTSSR